MNFDGLMLFVVLIIILNILFEYKFSVGGFSVVGKSFERGIDGMGVDVIVSFLFWKMFIFIWVGWFF